MRPKYNCRGGFSAASFAAYAVPRNLVASLVEAANHGLASNTHKSYKTAGNPIWRIEKATRKKLSFPFTVDNTLTYVGYLLKERNVSGASLDKYLSVS